MSELRYARSLRDLLVYQRAKSVATDIFGLTQSFPKTEAFSLTDQIRRSSRSIGAQIAEAWAKRRYEKHFVSKLTDADAEQHETQHWVDMAKECGYMSAEEADRLITELVAIGRMLSSMIEKADLFCVAKPDRVREEMVEYLAGPQ